MPITTRSFAAAKMNKDVDERTLPPGEYRDALNVQVSTSDGGNVGALQNIKGTDKVTSGVIHTIDATDVCVGMVGHPSTDKIYYLVHSAGVSTVASKDYILEYNTIKRTVAYVFVDIYSVPVVMPLVESSAAFDAPPVALKSLRAGMTCSVSNVDYTILQITAGGAVTLSGAIDFSNGNTLDFKAERVLELPDNGLITGINVLDDTIFWTDNVSEPKRVSISRSIAGTGGTAALSTTTFTGDTSHFHTRFTQVVEGTANTLEVLLAPYSGTDYPEFVSLQDITVIRKAPTQALTVTAFDTALSRVSGTTGYLNNQIIWAGDNPIGSTITGVTLNSPVDFRLGDIVLFTSISGLNNANGSYDIRTKVTASLHTADDPANDDGYTFEILSISDDLLDSYNDWRLQLDAHGEAFLDDKFVRFSYRYKYQDGEYSTFAPWSETAFLAGHYDYYAQEGYNKGMVNTIRSLKLENYTPVNLPKGVIEIDLLYKETNNPTVYTVKSVKPTDSPYVFKTDLVHAVVASNQLLRPWDNVPRKALAQEVGSNRIMYGNYLQGYDVLGDIEITTSYNSTSIAQLKDGVPSLKSLREYQVGVVFSDAYGRETPVLTSTGSSFEVSVEDSPKANKLTASLGTKYSYIPDWATYYSFYIKEPSVEYYTLAMDRWYNASDGNIWLSFPSSERNKLDEETFLYLKKAHGNNIPVFSGTEYRILAIENEAPDFIKTLYKHITTVENTGVVEGGSTDNQKIGTAEGGYPLVGTRTISVSQNEAGALDILGRSWRLSFYNVIDTSEMTGVYDVDKVTLSDGRYHFHIHGRIGNDSSFASTDNTWDSRIDTLAVKFYEGTVKSRPEFDGRFFVKVNKDQDVTNYVTAFEGDDWIIFQQQDIAYINNNAYTDGVFHKPELKASGATFSNPQNHPTQASHHNNYSWNAPGYPIADGTNTIEAINSSAASNFWSNVGDKFFIDRCSAYSWSGRENCFPGNFYGESQFSDGYWYASAGAGSSAEGSPYLDVDSGYGDNMDFLFLTNVEESLTRGMGLPSRGLWNYGDWGYMDISWTGFSDQPLLVPSGSGLATYYLTAPNISKLSQDTEKIEEHLFISTLYKPGSKFRFKNDPDSSVYTVNSHMPLLSPGYPIGLNGVSTGTVWYNNEAQTFPYNYDQYLEGHFGIRNYQTNGSEGQWNPNNLRQRWTVKVSPPFGSGPSQYDPTTGTRNNSTGITDVPALHHDGTNNDAIQILTPTTVGDDGSDISGGFVDNPAVWETKPKESVDIDIYYQASDVIPLHATYKTNEELLPTGSTFVNNSVTMEVVSWDNNVATLNSALGATIGNANITFTTPNGRQTEVALTGTPGQSTVILSNLATIPHSKHTLNWSNCWSFANGVESDRIRDDYNAPQMDNGVKASTVLAEQVREEHRLNGLIWSGIYNSTSGINETNQFVAAEKITKDVNPTYGSIQKLVTRDDTLVMLCEDKILSAVSKKDALYNADGNPQLIASNRVVGDVVPYKGDWGVSKNPESVAMSPKGIYFTDASRGAVLWLNPSGLSPISSVGMENYFLSLKDIAITPGSIRGTFDIRKGEYNVTLLSGHAITASFSERSKSWVSFKSFVLETGISLNNDYYSFNKGDLWLHHVSDSHNVFHGEDFAPSTVTTIFSDTTGAVKSFGTLNYTGSKARVTAFKNKSADFFNNNYADSDGTTPTSSINDLEYINLNAVAGWYMASLTTDLQNGGEVEFKEKEGKWFGSPTGIAKNAGSAFIPEDLNTAEFSTQGLGIAGASIDSAGGGDVTITTIK